MCVCVLTCMFNACVCTCMPMDLCVALCPWSPEHIVNIKCHLLPSEAIHQRVLYCDISDITNHRTDKYISVLGRLVDITREKNQRK